MDGPFEDAVSEAVEDPETTAFHHPDLEGCFTQDELWPAVYSVHNDKAPVLDGIVTEMMKLPLHISESYNLSLYHRVLERGQFPKSWCLVVICPLHKSGDRCDASN